MHRSRLSLVILLALAGGALSGLLLFDHHGVGAAGSAVEAICGPESESGCETVAQSRYSSIGNLSLAALGLVFYGATALLLALALVTSDAVRNAAAGVALVVFGVAVVLDLILFGLQAFAIGAYCKLCIGTYAANIAALALLWPWRGVVSSAMGTLLAGEGRRAFVVWGLGSLVLAVAIVSVERALASMAPAQQQTLLGEVSAPSEDPNPTPVVDEAPEPQPEPEPVTESEPVTDPAVLAAASARYAELEGELERERARSRELQATIDDPDKYQQYQMARAAAEFDAEERNELALDGIPFKGPAGAPIQVVEFSDFLCPFCRNLAGAFSNYMPQSGGKVAIFYKNYPLDQACNPGLSRTLHDGACEIALGAICAHEQGKFWPYHDQIFAQPPHNPSNDDIVRIAASAGLDGDRLRACLDSSDAAAKLEADIQEAKRLEVNSTPSVFINGKRLGQIGSFLQAIESEAKRLGVE